MWPFSDIVFLPRSADLQVDSPNSTSMMVMIQKRTTTWALPAAQFEMVVQRAMRKMRFAPSV